MAAVTASPASLSWNYVTVGETGGQKIVTLTNGNETVATISSITIGGANPGNFKIFSQTCGSSLAASASCTVNVVFAPTATGSSTATLTFVDSDSSSPQTVTLSGTGTSPTSTLTASPSTLSFATVTVGSSSPSQSASLYNGGSTEVSISSIVITGTNSSDFSISSKTCGTSISPNGTCSVGIVFAPSASGTRAAALTFTDTATNSPQTVSLSGTGGISTGFSISPLNPTVAAGGTVQFSATDAVTWTASCGTIGSTSGLYTAPSTAETCTVTAQQTASPNGTQSTSVTVTGAENGLLAIYPASAAVVAGTQQEFQAQLSGVPDTNSLSYSVDGVSGGNATIGTITNQGLYTAPTATGTHTVTVVDNAHGTSATSWVNVFSFVWVDFGSRASNQNPVPAGLFGAERLESMHNAADLDLVLAGGFTQGRTYAQIPTVFATSTPNWSSIDSTIQRVTANGGVHIMLQMYQMPSWLQESTYCGVYSPPSDLNAWGSIGAQYVKHMDTTFPGIVTDYEIWNEPNNESLCVPSGDNQMTDYMNMYRAIATQMKAQAQADGSTIRVGGPATDSLQATWVNAMLSDPTISQNIDFMSYHNYFMGSAGESAMWDTYNGAASIYQLTQDINGPANIYDYAGTLVAAGQQPQGKNLPIYVTEYNLDWLFAKNCCSNDPTYGPLWNALYVADLLDAPFGYNGAPNSMSRLIYYAATAPPYFCLVGEIDSNMDCTYPAGSVPQPYPQYFAYQLFGSTNYLGLSDGGYMAADMTPPRLNNGLVVTAFFNSTLDAIVLINPSQYTYTNMTVYVSNPGFTSPQATFYQIVGGSSIQTSTLSVQSVGGTNYATTVNIGPYSVQAISVNP
ncbi:MAG: choice-of-anchor D domain-containing protein [Terracidiphilus sp.]